MVQALRQQNLGSDAVATCRDVFAASTPATGAVSVFAHRVFFNHTTGKSSTQINRTSNKIALWLFDVAMENHHF